jgi:DNA gyrase/topoisomerase IV subunit A
LNQGKLSDEKEDLGTKQTELRRLLDQEEAVYEVMLDEFSDMHDRFGVDRKTKILNEDGEVSEIDMISNSRSGKF